MKRFLSFLLALFVLSAFVVVPCMGTVAFADDAETETEDDGFGDELSDVTKPIVNLLNSVLGILLALVGAAGAIFCVLLGVKYAKAEEPQDREKAKTHLKNAIIGFVLIFVLIFALRMMMPLMTKWVNANTAS